jgi:lipid-A-disaccharide synthase-like uncharacterized protein
MTKFTPLALVFLLLVGALLLSQALVLRDASRVIIQGRKSFPELKRCKLKSSQQHWEVTQ